MSLLHRGRWITLLGLALLAGVYVRALAFTPVERLQGPAQKIYYLHVPAAIWAETAMVLVGLGSIFYLFLKDRRLDRFAAASARSEEHTSELQSQSISYAVFCLKKKKQRLSVLCAHHDGITRTVLVT